jgi:DNA end-binding protein Ku
VPDLQEDGEQEELTLRPFWSGTLTFGLVSIPVNLFPAHRSGGVSLRMIDEDGTPLSRRFFCSKEDREISYDEIIRAYEIEKDEFVPITDEELEKLEPNKTRDIDLTRFVGRAEIDPMFFDRAYFLTPAGNSNKAYRLLAATLEQTARAGIATFVMREKEYLVAILSDNGILRAETLRFQDEIRTSEDLGLPAAKKPKPETVKKFERAIAGNEKEKLSLKELEDRHAARLLALVRGKEKRKEDVFELPEEQEKDSGDAVLDLMQLLKRSMSGKEESGEKTGRKRTAGSTTKRSRTKKSA